MQEKPAEEGKEVPFYDRKVMKEVGDSGSRRTLRAFLQKRVGASENTKKVMEQWSEMGLSFSKWV